MGFSSAMGLGKLVGKLVNCLGICTISYLRADSQELDRLTADNLRDVEEFVNDYGTGRFHRDIEQITDSVRNHQYDERMENRLKSIGEDDVGGNEGLAKWLAEVLFKYHVIKDYLKTQSNVLQLWESIEEAAHDSLGDNPFEFVPSADKQAYLEKLNKVLENFCLVEPKRWVQFFNGVVNLSGVNNPA